MAGYLAEGHNYGVVTGIGHLIVFDVDDLPRLEELNIINQIPETFTVETGRGGKHFYLLCRGFKDKMVLEDPGLKDLDGDPLHLGEIQALGEQVVGPGSLHPNGNYYKVLKNGLPWYIVWEKFQRIALLRQKCLCGSNSKRRYKNTLRNCSKQSHQKYFVDFAINFYHWKTEEAAFWAHFKGKSCCGTLDECPLNLP